MSTRGERRTRRNEDLVLKVTTNIDPKVWDESHYEAFLDELCGMREYQKEAIRTTLRYLLGGKYANLRELAKENFGATRSFSNAMVHGREWRGISSFPTNSHARLTRPLARVRA